LREIDLANSKAFAQESGDICGEIFVNRQYARKRGLDEDDFVRNACAQLKQDLLAWGERENLDVQVFMADELYSGEKTSLAPEVLFVVDDFRCSVSYRLEGPVYADRPHHPMKSGTHRLDGILIATGPRIMGGQIEGAQLQDIAPTLLHLVDAPAPSSMDGRILTEMLRLEFRSSEEPYQAPSGASLASEIEINIDEEDEDIEIVLQRLADLGYLD
jgi:predicted AlkP superfamily phosphohydrolase/phosphomutase